MKNNSCLLDRLFLYQMQLYANTTMLCDLHISCTQKKRNCAAIKRSCTLSQYENRKYQSKMCTKSLYHVTKNLKYKKTYKNNQITHYLEHGGTVRVLSW